VPPDGFAVAVPFEPPLQETGVALVLRPRAAGCVTVAVVIAEQPFASVVVTVYVPAERLIAVAVV
jgi:hypothetical protein